MQFSNKFSASPLGGLHQRLTDAYQAKCKKDKKFEDCELRANTNESKSLRVKTGDLSGWSTKTRNAHRVKAFPIVGREFLRSVDSLIAERKGLSSAVVAEIKKSAAINWSNYAASKQFLTVGDLPGLYTRAVRVVEEATPLTADEFETPNSEESMHPAPAGTGLPSSASLSSSSSTSSSSTSSSSTSSSSTSSSSTSSSSTSLPSSGPVSLSAASSSSTPSASSAPSNAAAAANAIKASYTLDRFPAAHGGNDALSSEQRQVNFHAKVDTLVSIAARFNPSVISVSAGASGYETLKRCAQSMKLDSGLTPAVALYKETSGPAANAIAKTYANEVEQYANRNIALAAAK